MSEPTAPRPTRRRPPIVRSKAMVWVAVSAVALIVGVAALYSQRGAIGTRLAVDYLEKRGVPATIRFERLSPDGFSGSAVLGPPNDPDLSIERLEVEFEAFPFVRNGLAPRVKSVRLVRPRLKATYANGKVTFGSLQGLIEAFLAMPVVGPPPAVVIEDGLARVGTPAGLVQVGGGASVQRGRVVYLDGRMGRHRLAADGRVVEIEAATLQLRGTDDRLTGRLRAVLPNLSQPGTRAQGAVLTAALDLPYGEGATAFDGRFGLEAALQASLLDAGETALTAPRFVLAMGGTSRGPLERLALTGRGDLAVEAQSLAGPADVRALNLKLASQTLSIARTPDGARFSAPLTVSGGAESLTAGTASLRQAALTGGSERLEGSLSGAGLTLSAAPTLSLTAARLTAGETVGRTLKLDLASSALSVRTEGAVTRIAGLLDTRATLARLDSGGVALTDLVLNGSGAAEAGEEGGPTLSWRGSARSQAGTSAAQARQLASTLAAAVPDEAALARALQTLRLDAPDLRLSAAGGDIRVALGAPVRLVGDGATIAVTARAGTPLAVIGPAGVRGALLLATSGAALPKLTLELPAYQVGPRGFSSDARFELADLDAGPLEGIDVAGAGRLTQAGNSYAFTARDCIAISADRIAGEEGPLATALRLRACPQQSRPLAVMAPGRWQVDAQIEDAGANLLAAEIEIGGGDGTVSVTGGQDGLSAGSVEVRTATVADRAVERRFQTVSTAGQVSLKGQSWIGSFGIADAAKKVRLAEVGLTHDMSTGQGGATIDAGMLTFAREGLQPADISPIAAGFMTDAVGTASFTGQIGWSEQGLTSEGKLGTTGLDFQTTMGRVQGMKGELALTGLAPLTTEAGQVITIEHIDWLAPLENAVLTLTLTPAEIKIIRARVGVGGGEIVLDPLDLKLGALLPTSGTLRLADVDLNQVLSGFDLGDKLSIQAKIDGTLPFAFTPEGLRFSKGTIFADGPGRLSIKREALAGVGASDASAATPPSAMQSFAYQALENLAFTQLDAGINSLPMGRLGILFHINGRNDPPERAVARIGILDLLQGKAFEQDIPLPSGTPVNLTLDTSLNFDELVSAYSNAGRSTPVQP